MMAHERISDYVSQGGKRIRSQQLRRLPDSISARSSPNLLQEKACESRVGQVLTGFGLT
jgi:hypothetical protein